jgi:hypothetical protein
MELGLICIPDDTFHVIQLGEKNFGVLDLAVMFPIGAVLCMANFLVVYKAETLVVFFHSGLN